MSTWQQGPFLAFDTETTGIDVWSDRIVTASVVEVHAGRRPTSTSWLLDPGIEIPEAAQAIHGITTVHAMEHGRNPGPALFEITARLALALAHGTPLIGFNIAFDLTILEAENHRHGNRETTLEARLRATGKKIAPIIDTHVIDKAMSRRKGSRKLVDVCAHYGVLLGDAHTADADALAAGRLFPRMVARYPELQAYPVKALHERQVVWRREQMSSLRAYFDRRGIAHDGCNPDWPIQRPLVAPAAQAVS